MNIATRLSALVTLALAPLAAFAANGFVTDDVSMRAGPDTDYPRITVLDEGTRVHVFGCIDGWEWCDVEALGERGWVAGRFVDLYYGGRRVVLYDYGPRLGVPIVTFSLGSYWGSHYRHRSFYDRRDYWADRYGGSRGYRYSYSPGYRSGERRYDSRSYDNRSYSGTTYAQPGYRYSQRSGIDRRYAQSQPTQYPQQTVIQQQQAQIRAQQFQQQRIARQQQVQQQQIRQQQVQQQQIQQQQIQQQAQANQAASQQRPDFTQREGYPHDRGHHYGQMARQEGGHDRGLHRGRDKDEKQR